MPVLAVVGTGVKIVFHLFGLLLALGLAFLVVKLAPGRTQLALDTIREDPGTSFLVGLLLWGLMIPSVIVLAIVMAILCITIIGIPIAAAAAVAYVAFFIVAGVWGSVVGYALIGRQLHSRLKGGAVTLVGAAMWGVVALHGLRIIGDVFHVVPLFGFLGGLFTFVSIAVGAVLATFGAGALARSEYRRRTVQNWWQRARPRKDARDDEFPAPARARVDAAPTASAARLRLESARVDDGARAPAAPGAASNSAHDRRRRPHALPAPPATDHLASEAASDSPRTPARVASLFPKPRRSERGSAPAAPRGPREPGTGGAGRSPSEPRAGMPAVSVRRSGPPLAAATICRKLVCRRWQLAARCAPTARTTRAPSPVLRLFARTAVATDSLLMLCVWLFLDGATLAVATTPLLLLYARRFEPWQVALAGGAASAAGSVVQLVVFRAMLAHERPWMKRFLPSRTRIEETLSRYPSASFLAIAVARATPLPDAPLKLVAAVVRYPLWRYFAAVLLGALPYYFVLALLGRQFKLPGWAIAAIAALFVAGLLIDLARRARARPQA